MNFQDNLRKYREQLGLSAKDFAAQLGIKYTTYANYENQGREPKYKTLCKIAAALHVSTDDLLGYKPNKADYWVNYLRKAGIHIDVSQKDNEIALYIGPENQEGLSPYLPIAKETFLNVMEKLEIAADSNFSKNKKQIITKWFIAFIISTIVKNENFDDEQSIKSIKFILGYLGLDYDTWLKDVLELLET